MKITSVQIYVLNNEKAAHWNPVICKINTDEEIYGYGEAAVGFGVGYQAGAGMIEALAPLIIGADPMENEVIWEKLYHSSFWGLGGGTMVFAGISAIDIALWDIKGKALGVPVYKLLGGKQRPSLRSYASQLQFGWDTEARDVHAGNIRHDPAFYAGVAQKAAAEGFDAIKIDFINFAPDGSIIPYTKLNHIPLHEMRHLFEERVAAVRKAIPENIDVIVENHALTDAVSAVEFGRMLEAYNIYYYEEVAGPLNPEVFKEVANHIKIPLASGERIYSRFGYLPFLKNYSLKVLQPDLGTAGGITEVKKISDLGYIYDASVQVHVCGSPIVIAATLHLETAIPNFIIHEHHAPREHNRAFGVYDYPVQNGQIKVPELPGIGQELSELAIKTARYHITVC